jgi:flagellar hook-associated protein 1 FlgK
MTGGEIGGLINYRSEILDEAQNTLGLIALGITDELNTQHQRGMDLDGNLGDLVFTAPETSQGVVSQDASATGTVAFAYDDITDLTSSDYSLVYNGGTSYTLTRLSDGTAFFLDTATPSTLTNDGFTLTLGGAPAVGETTYIRPTRGAAGNIELNLVDARQVAAASPVLAEAGSDNAGTGVISTGTVNDITNAAFTTTAGALTPPIIIEFTSATTFDVINGSTLAVIAAGVTYTAGNDPLDDASLDYGYTVEITGTPATGDTFTIDYNTDGIGDNRNALELGQLQSTDVLLGDSTSSLGATATFEETYTLLISGVGNNTSVAESNYNSQQALLDYNEAAMSSVSGVNLDEEAANLVRYQQAYQAAAQVISVANELFDTLIGAFR